jgi:K+-transporting ATPase ATPase C chain
MRTSLLGQLVAGLRILLVMTVMLGVAYPLAIVGVAQLAFDDRADGQIVELDGEPVGSSLLGQAFVGEQYFHPRPSAVDHDPAASGGSNLGPTAPAIRDLVASRIADYRELNGIAPGTRLPVDAVTASASGLDPHISPANAQLQAPRVARVRGLDLAAVVSLVDDHVEHRPLGVLGDDVVNVFELNIAIDAASARP